MVKETMDLIGKEGLYSVGTLKFRVIIRNARTRFGFLDLLIEPKHGTGQQWVEQSKVRINFPEMEG